MRNLATTGLINSAHDCAEGGLLIAIAESIAASKSEQMFYFRYHLVYVMMLFFLEKPRAELLLHYLRKTKPKSKLF
ncbi:MAG: hypothetical protein OMM_10455 [Candidatus Magnetoglobus multicellularis str. Araruama]|uniref:PurM-like C-terminal domain-containing protein n=1 Tax=Candidatus Magnetoglobus multicellularis str. Araruama TaxID=890399 RepID=A0A1V1P114_9BACT|nr:MAG: hypothetical protein OMM_10455 [Candidatus Magnetoglobus multicellularis str. Araruama]